MATLDIRSDLESNRSELELYVGDHEVDEDEEEGEQSQELPITRIDLEFGITSGSPLVHGFLDTDPEGRYATGKSVRHQVVDWDVYEWEDAINLEVSRENGNLEDEEDPGPLEIVTERGAEPAVGEAGICKVVGDALARLLQRAQQDGVFANLRRAKRCQLGVGEFEGMYFWSAELEPASNPAPAEDDD